MQQDSQLPLPLFYYGHPILRKKAEPITEITEEIRTFIQHMIETMRAHRGLGISAPQVGRSIAVFVASPPMGEKDGKVIQGPPRVYINPELTDPSVEHWEHSEGCLSIPKVFAQIARPVRITITALDIDGKQFSETLTEWPARVIMHENDHLNGVLFIDRLPQKQRHALEPQLRIIKAKYKYR